MSNEKMRESFEEWYSPIFHGGEKANMPIRSNGEYRSVQTQIAWMAWQAATAATQRDAMAVAEAVRRAQLKIVREGLQGGRWIEDIDDAVSRVDLAAIVEAVRPATQTEPVNQRMLDALKEATDQLDAMNQSITHAASWIEPKSATTTQRVEKYRATIADAEAALPGVQQVAGNGQGVAHDSHHVAACCINPCNAAAADVLAMAARIEELELVAERNELLWAGGKEKAKELERERDAAVEARREAQTETQLAREERNRAGIEARRGMFKLIKDARLEGWQAAMEAAGKVCDGRAGRNEREAQDAIADGEQGEATSLRAAAWQMSVCGAYLRAMQPPGEWQCAEVAPACGAAPNVEWGHEDGFGGGLTERSK